MSLYNEKLTLHRWHLKIKSNGTIEATYEDESADLELEGKAAQDKIMTLLDGLSIKTATNEQIKEHITKKLSVNEQVKKLSLKLILLIKQKLSLY